MTFRAGANRGTGSVDEALLRIIRSVRRRPDDMGPGTGGDATP